MTISLLLAACGIILAPGITMGAGTSACDAAIAEM
jgi:hypothetical protein